MRLISKFMISQPGEETFTAHLIPNQTMKSGQVI